MKLKRLKKFYDNLQLWRKNKKYANIAKEMELSSLMCTIN